MSWGSASQLSPRDLPTVFTKENPPAWRGSSLWRLYQRRLRLDTCLACAHRSCNFASETRLRTGQTTGLGSGWEWLEMAGLTPHGADRNDRYPSVADVQARGPEDRSWPIVCEFAAKLVSCRSRQKLRISKGSFRRTCRTAAVGQFQTVARTSQFAGKQRLTRRPAPGDPKPPPGTQPMYFSRARSNPSGQ